MAALSYTALRTEYATLWDSMVINDRLRETIERQAKRIIANRSRYEPVEAATGVPWFCIGIIHIMECGGSFSKHLHNGDPLTARTVQVPKGRPLTGRGPFTWEESAVDAIRYDKLDKVANWTVEQIAWCLERFNGMGYRRRAILSPYLWSGTDHYVRGKFVRDGVWSATAVSAQAGAMPILKRIAELDRSVTLRRASGVPEVPAEETTPDSFRKTDAKPVVVQTATKSKTIAGALTALLGGIAAAFSETIAVLMDAATQIATWAPIQSTFGMVKGLGIGLLVCGVALAIYRRLVDAKEGRS